MVLRICKWRIGLVYLSLELIPTIEPLKGPPVKAPGKRRTAQQQTFNAWRDDYRCKYEKIMEKYIINRR